ncbi:uncharacterized protein EV422DRAFT_285557 [Fimicolochytrium jonesii]|uniref:uncharacterized protein n=1 Tax=Fimicolochytrium jonesii TaxID=1396493 RepID=UPI0022FEFDDA|nr:uncharacterized protein EV422DRAFT_285557 [Fimicolochytrium jonesii]KAI8816495.1 hypothetical protein EV422DRAFT_285557 [Fimicolochytrium jonesii]
MSFLAPLLDRVKHRKTLAPALTATPTRLTIVPVDMAVADWALVGAIVLFGVVMVALTSRDLVYSVAGGGLYVYLASTLIVDKYITTLDKPTQEVTVTKTTLGFIRYVRVAPLDELVSIDLLPLPTTSASTPPPSPSKALHRLELVFMSSHGYYHLPLTETYVRGEANKRALEGVEGEVRKWAGLKKVPEWMGEEALERSAREGRAKMGPVGRRGGRRGGIEGLRGLSECVIGGVQPMISSHCVHGYAFCTYSTYQIFITGTYTSPSRRGSDRPGQK